MADAILDEAAKFTREVLAPLNRVGDTQGCTWTPEGVTTPDGWKEAYNAFREAGWSGITLPTEYGGQGLPSALGIAVQEMVCSANLGFSLGPLLTSGAVEALLTCASDELKATYLEKMVTGEWTGTMNLTEPQAGSDLALIRSRAEPQADGSYKVFGQKIFISYGDHDMTDNIVHLVLARLPDAPAGVKGISMFLVGPGRRHPARAGAFSAGAGRGLQLCGAAAPHPARQRRFLHRPAVLQPQAAPAGGH